MHEKNIINNVAFDFNNQKLSYNKYWWKKINVDFYLSRRSLSKKKKKLLHLYVNEF